MEKIITIKPTFNKSFKNYISNKNKLGHIDVYNFIKRQTKNLKLDKNDEQILKKILSSYEKVLNNDPLSDENFLFKDQEINELKDKSGLNLIRYLSYRYKYNVYPVIKNVSNFPPSIQIELASICNLRCVMCYQHDKSFSSKSNGYMGYMDFNLFKKIIDEVEGNMEAITFASRGEPTLNKDLGKFLKYCENKFLGIKLNTNATMFNEKIINMLLSSDLETLVLSIDAAEKEMYEKIRVNSKFEKIIKNLELFKKIRENKYKNSKLKVRISGVMINKNQNIDEIKKYYSNFADEFALVNYTPWESSYDNEINDITDPCSDLWRRMFVWWDGKANPCDYDYKSILSKWNVKEFSISEIWNSTYYNDLRQKHLNKLRCKVEPCKRCIAR